MKTAKSTPHPTPPSGKNTFVNGSESLNGFDSFTIACLKFDRSGQIRRINTAAARLFDRSPLSMLGQPFASFIARHDAEGFLHHLLRCRMKEMKVETTLHLKTGAGEKIPVRLSSVCVSSDAQGVRFRYHTTLTDLRKQA